MAFQSFLSFPSFHSRNPKFISNLFKWNRKNLASKKKFLWLSLTHTQIIFTCTWVNIYCVSRAWNTSRIVIFYSRPKNTRSNRRKSAHEGKKMIFTCELDVCQVTKSLNFFIIENAREVAQKYTKWFDVSGFEM